MTFEEKKEILCGYRKCDAQIRYYQQAIEQCKETKMQAGTQKISAVPFVTGASNDLSDYIVKLDEMYGELYSKMIKALNYKHAVLCWIAAIEDTRERLVITYKYLEFKTIEWIAENMEVVPICERTVNRALTKGIENLPDIETDIFQNLM